MRSRRSCAPALPQRASSGATVMSTWPEVLGALIHREDLTTAQATWAMDQVMTGAATSAQIASFAVALRAKGETAAEVSALVDALLTHATAIDLPGRWVDTCGTGGDRAQTINISTAAAIIVAACGVPVVKHGNRAASSLSGSADVLEALGISISLTPEQAAAVGQECGITFLFAPTFHPALRHAGPTRKEIGVPTFFNILGPLANPARPVAQAVGVADRNLASVMAQVLADRGVDALVLRGDDGLDELSLAGPSQIWMVHAGAVRQESVEPESVGLKRSPIEALRGGDAAENARAIVELLDGKTGAVRDAVLLNAAAALAAYRMTEQHALPLIERLRQGIAEAANVIDSGRGSELLNHWREVSARY
jgi:anthranilate phosphoribosyltransferase